MNQTLFFSLIDAATTREKRTSTRSINEIFNVRPRRQLRIYIEIKFSYKCVQSSWHKCCSQLVRALSSTQTNNKHINKTAKEEENGVDLEQDEEMRRWREWCRRGGKRMNRKKSFLPKLTKDKLIENRKKGSNCIGKNVCKERKEPKCTGKQQQQWK